MSVKKLARTRELEGAARLAAVEAIVFDLDDVLFDKGDWIVHSLEYAADHLGLDGMRALELATEFRDTNGVVDYNIYNHILLGLGQSDSGRNIKALCDQAAQYKPRLGEIELYPGVRMALAALAGTHKLGLITDGPVLTQRAKVQTLELTDYFRHILYTDSIAGVASRKPDPRPFEHMWLTLKARKEHVLIIGSNPRKDFELRNKEGFLTMRVLTGELAGQDYQEERFRAQFCVNSVAEIPSMIEQARSLPAAAQTEDTLQLIA